MWSQDRYLEAYHFAARAHLGQLYVGTDLPYIMHLSFVSMELIAALRAEPGRDEDLALTCALLHDVIEDTPIDHAQVAAAFGRAVADGVLALTKDESLPEDAQMADSLRRIRAQPPEVWMVKLADRITNLQPPPGHWSPAKVAGYRAEAERIFAELAEASPFLAARLRAKIDGYA